MKCLKIETKMIAATGLMNMGVTTLPEEMKGCFVLPASLTLTPSPLIGYSTQ